MAQSRQHPLHTAGIIVSLVSLVGFAVRLSFSHPGRKAVFSRTDFILRAGVVLSGVLLVAFILGALLPRLMNTLETRGFPSFVATRHVRSKKSGFLGVISMLSICGVAISSCSLSTAISVMGGFNAELKRKILGNNAHILVDTVSQTPWSDSSAVLDRVRAVPGVTGATPMITGEVMAQSAYNTAGVVVSGIEAKSIGGVLDLPKVIEVGTLDYLDHPEKLRHLPANEVLGYGPQGEEYHKGPDLGDLPKDLDPEVQKALNLGPPARPGIVVGRELAKTLRIYLGDEVTLVSPLGDLGPLGVMPRTKKFRVAAIFYSALYEYDASHVYVTRDEARDYFATEDKVNSVVIKVKEAETVAPITSLVRAAIMRDDLQVRDWTEMNSKLFSALKLERAVTFFVLSLAIMVASFCIVSTLLLMVTEKAKEIAILKAIGASDGAITRTFMVEGIIIGGIGTVFGVATSIALCGGLKWIDFPLDPDIYYIDRLPMSVNFGDFLLVGLASLAICSLATTFPARAAAALRPVDGLRYE